jgi:dolichol-phosphate mannosyltransferase
MAGDTSTSASISANEQGMEMTEAPAHAAAEPRDVPAIAVVVPVRNEAGNVAPLVAEIEAACAAFPSFEVVYVDDGSTDATPSVLAELAASKPWLRSVRHEASCGQSAAVRTGVRRSRAPIVVTIDGDGQNDPAYIPRLVAALEAAGPKAGLAAGQRLGRKDTGFKKVQSRVANAVRNAVLRDGTRDTGCGLKGIRREVYLALPYFDALHRFMPALVKREGYDVVLVDVVDRPRLSGVSNYGFFDRLWVGILDLLGVWWLVRRRRAVPRIRETA